ncbi:MAG: putative toxin-antitoxin system toxin component, PIN family [Deltaproteobacteria bacterium]|nr:putative toxin-antitoxin system toxin component, PIN family [Deltaproteobacteria bacterium]
MRVVLDTNVFISGILGGSVAAVIDGWKEGRFEVVVNDEIVREYAVVLGRPRFGLTADIVETVLGFVLRRAEFVTVTEPVRAIEADPDDDKFLAVATAARVDLIVSGDHHLLELGSWEGIPVVTPRDFLNRL